MEEKTIRQNDEVEIDLLGLCLMLLHHLPVILPAALLTALCAFLYTSLFLSPPISLLLRYTFSIEPIAIP